MAISFCAVGRSFSDQLSEAQNVTDKMLQNSMKQLDSVNSKLSAKYEKLYAKLTDNGYKQQLKNAVILKAVFIYYKAFREFILLYLHIHLDLGQP